MTGRCETPSERSPQDESQDARRRLRHAGFTCTARYLRRLAGRSTNSAARSLTMGKPHARPSVAHGLDSSRLPEGWRLHRIWLAPAALAPCAGKPALIPALLSIDRRLAVPLFGQRARQHPPEKTPWNQIPAPAQSLLHTSPCGQVCGAHQAAIEPTGKACTLDQTPRFATACCKTAFDNDEDDPDSHKLATTETNLSLDRPADKPQTSVAEVL